jgi:pimeloyl-ACP methyl ester carboxylesterase
LGYTVWAPNLRGYGNSSRPTGVNAYQITELLADVAGLIDAAGAASTLLVGHDWGGALAWMFALQKQRPLSGLVVMNLPHPLRFYQGARRWPQWVRSWYILAFQLPGLPEWLLRLGNAVLIGRILRATAVDPDCFSEDVLAVYREQASQPGALTAMINYYRANFSFGPLEPDLQALLETPLATPTLMIWGEADRFLGKELTEGTDRLVPHLTLRYLPGVSHWVQQEAPDPVNGMLAEWLS